MTDTPRRHPHVVNIDELPSEGFSQGERFALQNRPLGQATGALAYGPGDQHWIRQIFRNDSAVDYYDGELEPTAT